jgi:succinylglutamic semialdehyde dehydrogenase
MSGSHLIGGEWHEGGGQALSSRNPATGEPVWTGRAAMADDVGRAVATARKAFEGWSSQPVSNRIDLLNAFAAQLKQRRSDLVEMICRETGKPRWESGTEVDAMIGKVAISIDANDKRRHETSSENAGVTSATRYKPYGVVAVLGPFNFPGHLPNGHIVPALLAGNTVVFKPSDLTPGVAQLTVELWQAAGLPPGVLNLVQGGRETGVTLVEHSDTNGVFFTGSFNVGRAINRALADHPGKIAALEMGGNNPLIVHNVSDLDAAAYWTIWSAFITAGQRCSCARRLIVPEDANGNAFIDQLVEMTQRIVVGPYTQSPEPFMGPVITDDAAQKLLSVQLDFQVRAAGSLVEMKSIGKRPAMLSPGIIDVTGVKDRADTEHFGPLLQLIRVKNFDEAIDEANATKFGLAAGLFSDDRSLWETFYRRSRAGVVNFNRPLTGASSALPFGGVGNSGNNRPSAYFAADYCSYPVATMEIGKLAMPTTTTPGIA